MVSELLCTTYKNANYLACGRLRMGRKAKATSGCQINVVCIRPRCLCRPRYLGRLGIWCSPLHVIFHFWTRKCETAAQSKTIPYITIKGWMDQDAIWYGGRTQLRRLCVRWGPSSPPQKGPPFPQIDIIGAMVIFWRARGKIIRSVLCNIVCNDCAQCNAHT